VIQTTAKGPLFAGTINLLAANVRASNEHERILGGMVRSAYTSHRGPGRYGHLADNVRTQTTVAGDSVAARIFPAPRVAFKARFLESGTTGHFITARRRGRRALMLGPGIFRPYVHHPGTRGLHILERLRQAYAPQATLIQQREIAKELGA
jgi:hypothetical protein